MTTRERGGAAGALHEFRPERYWSTFGQHAPALHIAPGDRVATSTADAFGRDASGDEVTAPGNPLTGPFFVEGAERGDALVVRLERIVPNRAWGTSFAGLAQNTVEPSAVAELPERARFDWTVDLTGGVATLSRPGAAPERISVPLAPMLGCVGVAPDRDEAISSLRAGFFGGNLDYRHMVEGIELWLPVSVPGALLFVGDGHAAQGDGELVATGIEISMDVEFSVELRKGARIATPRAENAEFILAIGVQRPYERALQIATTEMYRWLQQDHGFDAPGASQLLGMCAEYEVASVYVDAMVCKMPKRMLEEAG